MNIYETANKAFSHLTQKQKVCIVTHTNPDGDAIGSSLGLYNYLIHFIDSVTVLVPNDYPDYLQWMAGNEHIIVFSHNREVGQKKLAEADIVFCLDFNELRRISEMGDIIRNVKAIKILIDHHPFPEPFADFEISDSSACATAELVFDFIQAMPNREFFQIETAECIFAGILMDTGNFSHNASNPHTYEIISQLLRHGIDRNKIHSNINDNFTENRMRLMGYCLYEKMEVLSKFNTAFISINREDQMRFHFGVGDSEGFVNMPFSIQGIRFSVLFVEYEDYIKLSLRSRGNFDVNKFARTHYDGGGHINASGGKSKLPINETIKHFIEILESYEEELNS